MWIIVIFVICLGLRQNPLCLVFGHRNYLRGRYARWSDADILYYGCKRSGCGHYWRRVSFHRKWYERNPRPDVEI